MEIGEDGAELGRVTITGIWGCRTGAVRFGKSLSWLMVGMFGKGSSCVGCLSHGLAPGIGTAGVGAI